MFQAASDPGFFHHFLSKNTKNEFDFLESPIDFSVNKISGKRHPKRQKTRKNPKCDNNATSFSARKKRSFLTEKHKIQTDVIDLLGGFLIKIGF